jgi:hypothetical protein
MHGHICSLFVWFAAGSRVWHTHCHCKLHVQAPLWATLPGCWATHTTGCQQPINSSFHHCSKLGDCVPRLETSKTLTKIWNTVSLNRYLRPAHQPTNPPPYRQDLLCLPYFYLLGHVKGGTSDLWAFLSKHPDINPGRVLKEQHYFSRWVGDTNKPTKVPISLDVWVPGSDPHHWCLSAVSAPLVPQCIDLTIGASMP